MRAALLVLAILAMIVNVISTLSGVVMLMAGAPNSSPEQLLFLKRMMIVFGIVGLLCLIVSIILVTNRMLAWSIAVSLFPFVFTIGFFIWAYVKEI